MARAIRSIDIYLPVEYNDGSPIENSKFVSLQRDLLHRFGGVTSMQRQFPLQGLWQAGNVVYEDRVILFTMLDFHSKSQLESLRYLTRLKERLKKRFEQLEILITVQEILAI
ncbi:MAG: hypothetical protein L0Y72_21170 [Gemmataceae bacterium]|nr:hypothetical protein [Gemmataceae bacterium]MCI0741554.1 hypothetical protein [Gemmataceae bacterium]